MKKLIYGVGINDADYNVQPTINGKQVVCLYYSRWHSMLQRCYSENYHKKYPTYVACEVAHEWKTFSNFKTWMMEQDWAGKHLDKDILFPDNKLYSRDTCVFIGGDLNNFLCDSRASRGTYLIGVIWHKRARKFTARCRDGGNKLVHLGSFDNELEAHQAWKAYKHELACKLADKQSDTRVAEALRKRFAPEIKGETNE